MTTEKLLWADYTSESGKAVVQKALRKIGPLAKCEPGEDVPLEKVERLIKAMVAKYEIVPQWICMDYTASDKGILFSVGVKSAKTHQWLGSVHGVSAYEVFAKLAIKMYAEIRSGNVARRPAGK